MLTHDLGDGYELAPIEPWQAELFAAHLDHVRPSIRRWVPMASRNVDVASCRAWLQRYADGHAADERYLWGVWHDDGLVGGVLFPHFDTAQGVCEIGIWLAPEAEGLGVGRRSLEPLLEWAFEQRGLVRVEWQAAPGNERSIALAERLGFRREGVLRQAAVVDGARQDTVLLALLAGERRPA